MSENVGNIILQKGYPRGFNMALRVQDHRLCFARSFRMWSY